MAYIDVKITDLTQISSIERDDLLLVSHPLLYANGTLQNTPYTSNSISGGALSATIKDALRNDDLSIEGKWNFHTTKLNLPTQDFRFAIGNFLNALETLSCLSSIVSDGDSSGWYHNLSSSICQSPEISGAGRTVQSISVLNNTIPNIDFVERIVAGAYKNIMERIGATFNGAFLPSHVGQIIHSTTLSDINAVKAVYGDGTVKNGIKTPNTNWKQHSGYILRGATPNDVVKFNTLTADAGEDQHTINISNTHNHNFSATHNHNIGGVSVKVGFRSYETHGSGGTTYNIPGATGSGSISSGAKTSDASISGTTGNASISISKSLNNWPPHKNVYIWERIS